MEQVFKEHINQHFSFLKGKKLLVAVSGGMDSIVLTHLLYQNQFNIALAHCNFSLRNEESNEDERFVKKLAQTLEIDCFTKIFDTQSIADNSNDSVQMIARKLRYDWFQELCKSNGFDYILTAHHLDDSLETFFINLTRGTGLDGLTGIKAINGNIVRPLLHFSREQIANFAQKNNITWREDASNASLKYLRNAIRHEVIPKLKDMQPNLLQAFKQTNEHLLQTQAIVQEKVNEVEGQVFSEAQNSIDLNKLKSHKNYEAYLYEILKKYGFTAWNDVYNLVNAQSGKYVESATHRLIKNRDELLLQLRNNSENKTFLIDENTCNLDTSFGKISIENWSKIPEFESKNAYVDKDLLIFPLQLRKWQNGDYFYPLGMKGKQKISDFCINQKLSLIDKENLWLLCNGNNEVIWIVNRRLDNRYKITENTQNTLKISIQ